MIKEIYCKMPADAGYAPNIESTDEAYNILQQIKVVLGTQKGQILGTYGFGVDL
jgi:hypothetical protein